MKLESSVAYNVFVEIRKITLKVQTYLLSQNSKKLVEFFLPKSAIYLFKNVFRLLSCCCCFFIVSFQNIIYSTGTHMYAKWQLFDMLNLVSLCFQIRLCSKKGPATNSTHLVSFFNIL